MLSEDASTCVVADDETLVRARIAALARAAGLEVVGEAASGTEAREMILAKKPDIALLDIRMPGASGLDVLERLSGMDEPPAVVLVTAYAEHALAAFALSAVDYVVKPVDPTRLAAALARARQVARGRQARAALERLRGALLDGRPERLSVRVGASVVSLAWSDVLAFHAEDDYVEAELPGGRHLLSLTLSALERVLPAPPFLRVHRSHLVNLDRVRALERRRSGAHVVVLENGSELPVARARAEEVKQRFGSGTCH